MKLLTNKKYKNTGALSKQKHTFSVLMLSIKKKGKYNL